MGWAWGWSEIRRYAEGAEGGMRLRKVSSTRYRLMFRSGLGGLVVLVLLY